MVKFIHIHKISFLSFECLLQYVYPCNLSFTGPLCSGHAYLSICSYSPSLFSSDISTVIPSSTFIVFPFIVLHWFSFLLSHHLVFLIFINHFVNIKLNCTFLHILILDIEHTYAFCLTIRLLSEGRIK